MRIVSKFKDYYDSAMGFGIDTELVYVREKTEVKLERNRREEYSAEYKLIISLKDHLPPNCDFLSRGVISFCGTAYPFWRDSNTTDPKTGSKIKGKTFYSLDRIIQHLQSQPNTEENRAKLASLSGERSRKYRNYRYWGWKTLDIKTWELFQKEHKPYVGDDIHRHFKSPVLSYWGDNGGYPSEFLINPCLRDYDFASQVDPYRAFQELSMYLGNNLVEQKDPNVNIPDELKAQSKGFDKWSFRKMPSKK